jgi:hypothetical protein
MKTLLCVLLTFVFQYTFTSAQSKRVNRNLFFADERVIEATFTTDIKKLRQDKRVPVWQPAHILMHFPDSAVISEEIQVQPRGKYRKTNCDIASLMLNFKTPTSPKLSALKKLKLVGGCAGGSRFEELLLKEYLVYRIYNELSIMGFQVRLLHVNYKDSKQKNKPYSQYAFLIEDMEDLAVRNNCKEVKNRNFSNEATNRQQMTLVYLFQYMIGNTDWTVYKYHNVKLMVPKNDTLAKPYTVPYDFDYAGIVNAPYAVPNEELGIKDVKERLYRGFERSMEELQEAIKIFQEKKSRIMFIISSFPHLNEKVKKEMLWYLEDFYKIIDDKRLVKYTFISNARRH